MPAPEPSKEALSGAYQDDLHLIREAALEAGRIALGYFGKDPKVWMKEGDSPVSEADHAANDYLEKTLMAARPDYGWLSEETTDNDDRLSRQRVFVVDPIDGTKGFIKAQKKWCVSIAVVEDGRPLCGVLECPALEETFHASKGNGAWLNGQKLRVRKVNRPLAIAGPGPLIRNLTEQLDTEVEPAPFVPSLAYRLACVADGRFDGNFARPNCHDWDIAAADLILHEAGALLGNFDGSAIIYNRNEIKHDILVAARQPLFASMLDAVANQLKQEKS